MEKFSEMFKRAIGIVDKEKSGNPDQKYSPGSIQQFAKKAEEGGEYKPYIEDVVTTAKENLPKLEKQIKEMEGKGSTVSLEHSNPEEYRRQKEESLREDELENNDEIEKLKVDIKNSLN